MMTIQVHFFGPAKDYAVAESATLELENESCVADLRSVLVERHPGLRNALPSIRIAVNETFAKDDQVLRSNDAVALIPPVSGGCGDGDTWIELVNAVIPAERAFTFVSGDPRWGGIVTFSGATRVETDDGHGPLVRLEYEAYSSMAVAQLERLAAEAKARWQIGKTAILHRLGPVAPGELSVMIAVACAHRAEAFDACRWLIDALKRDVPIWKRDVHADGFARWVDPTGKESSTMLE